MNRRRYAAIVAVVNVAALVLGGVVATNAGRADAVGPTLIGGGSSFASLEIDQWRAEFARKPYEMKVNYTSQGSTFGRNQYAIGAFDFAASDIPFLKAELPTINADRKDFVYVPVSAGGLGLMYNVVDTSGNQVKNLNLTRHAVCRMFTEPDMRWTDPEIAAANPGIAFQDEYVRPIVRADGSGTSYVFSEFCIAVAPDVWQAFRDMVAAKNIEATDEFRNGEPTSNWPQNWGKVASAIAADGVAAAVADSQGGKNAITYNEAGYAKVKGFPNANVENGAGKFMQPTEEAVSRALAYAIPNGDGTFKLQHSTSDPDAYFPSTYSYVIAQTTGMPTDKGEVLARFLCYAVTKGQRQELTLKLEYARLSQQLVDIARASIAKIPGAPAWENCAVQDAAPPPTAPPTVAPTVAATAAPAAGGSTGGGSTSGGSTGGGSAGGGSAAGGSTGGGATGGSSTGGGSAAGGSAAAGSTTKTGTPAAGATGTPTATSIVTDPATGSTSVVNLDPAAAGAVDQAGGVATGTDSITAGALVPSGAASATPAAARSGPTIDTSSDGPSALQISWVLLQGAGVCGLGGFLATNRRRGRA